MKYVALIIATLPVVVTVLPLFRSDRWWVRIWDFPRLQIAFVLLACIVALPLFFWDGSSLDYAYLVFMIGALWYQGYMIFPYTPLARKQVTKAENFDEASTISLFFANVLQDNRNSKKLLDMISRLEPDIVLAVETDIWWLDQLKELEKTYPHRVQKPLENTYGMLLYSRLELLEPEIKYLIEEGVPSIHTRVKLRSGAAIVMRCLHPPPPFPTVDESSKERDAELVTVGREIKKLGEPALVFGDLNDVAWSGTNYLFQAVSGLLDPRIGRGFFNTFHAGLPFLRCPLDHCFHSPHFKLVDFRRMDYFGSDHFPIFTKLSHEPNGATEQEPISASPEDEVEADEMLLRVQE